MHGRLPRTRERGGATTGPSPVDRCKTGSKHHLICDGKGASLKVITTVVNGNDVAQFPPVADRIGHTRKRPEASANPTASDCANAGTLALC